MDILITPPDRFGLMPEAKQITLGNIYLITNGNHPDLATKAIFCSENAIVVAAAIANTKAAMKFLGGKGVCWFIQDEKWIKHTPMETTAKIDYEKWKEQGIEAVYNDYNVESVYQLYTDIQDNAPWMLILNQSYFIANLAGVSFDNMRQLKPYIKIDTKALKARTVKVNQSAVNMMRGIYEEYKDINSTIIPIDEAEHPLVQFFKKNGECVDDDGYTILTLDINVKRAQKNIQLTHVIRYKGKPRKVLLEKNRYALNNQNYRYKATGEDDYSYFATSYLKDSTSLLDALYKNDEVMRVKIDSWKEDNPDKLQTLINVFGSSLLMNDELMQAIGKLDIELNAGGQWKKVNVSRHFKLTDKQEAEYQSSKLTHYSALDDSKSKNKFCFENYGIDSLSRYLVHPLHSKGYSIETEPAHWYWMNWCELNKPTFIEK